MNEQLGFLFFVGADAASLTIRAKPRARRSRKAKQQFLFAELRVKPKLRRRAPSSRPRMIESATVDIFVRLLEKQAQTYLELMAATGVSFRTAKERLRAIRRTHEVKERHLPSESVVSHGRGRGPKQMWIGDAEDGDDSYPVIGPPPPTEIRTACPLHKGSRCMHCDGSGFRVFSPEAWKKKREAERARLAAAL